MGNTFLIKEAVFRGHAVEDCISSWGAVAIGQSSAPERTVGQPVVPCFWCQPQDCLQVEGAFYGPRASGFEQSEPTPTTESSSVEGALGTTNSKLAPKASLVGAQEDQRVFSAPGLARALRTDYRAVAQAVEIEPPGTPKTSQSVRSHSSQADPGETAQSRLDGRFQRLVPNWQRRALRTADGEGFVQSLRTAGASVAHATHGADQGRLY